MYAHYLQKERPDLEKKYKLEKVINTEHKQHDRYEKIRNGPRIKELTDLEKDLGADLLQPRKPDRFRAVAIDAPFRIDRLRVASPA